VRSDLLQLSELQMADVARYANRYPNIELSYEIEEKNNLKTSVLLFILLINNCFFFVEDNL
jgi:hypothetical protein